MWSNKIRYNRFYGTSNEGRSKGLFSSTFFYFKNRHQETSPGAGSGSGLNLLIDVFRSDEERLEYLFRLYEDMIQREAEHAKENKGKREGSSIF